MTMEDAHLCHSFDLANFPHLTSKSVTLFGIYDGHGGSQVSRFVANHIVEELCRSVDFHKGRLPAAFNSTMIH
jgi:serine/threonine protein phosphatase PrpC